MLMASEIDPYSVLEVTFSVSEKEESVSTCADKGPNSYEPASLQMANDHGVATIVSCDDSPLKVPLNLGWRREVVLRANNARRLADIYYLSPNGKRCRSSKEIAKEILGTELTLENFTFNAKILGINDPSKELIRPAKDLTGGKRASLDQSLEKTDRPAKKTKLTHKRSKMKLKPENVDCQDDLPENTSVDITGGLEYAEAGEKDETGSMNVLTSLNPSTEDTSNNEPTCSSPNIPTSTTSEPENCPNQLAAQCCFCDMCSKVDKKCRCCWDIPSVQVVKSNYQCITLLPSFKKLILDRDVLSLTRHLLSVKTKNKTKKSLLNSDDPLHITWRYIAYKQFVSWINSCTAIGSRTVVTVPSCVIKAVRERFPEHSRTYGILSFTT